MALLKTRPIFSDNFILCKNILTLKNFIFRIDIKLGRSTIVYKALLLSQIKEFFVLQAKSRYQLNVDTINSKLRHAFSSRLEDLKNATKTELVHAVDNLLKGQTKVVKIIALCNIDFAITIFFTVTIV